jgi:TolB-like protein
MAANPNKLSQFWQELKRRNVIRVITVYAGVAFVILELTDIIAEPLKLPSWLLPVVIVLLSIGFIIAVILSWIYDIHPDEGMVKTVSVNEIKSEKNTQSSNTWKIASYISFVVILALITFNIFSRNRIRGEAKFLYKSIAIMPFVDQSPEGENQYIVNNLMMSILESLSNIEGVTIKGRSSTEQYRNTNKSPQEIGEKLSVNYLIEGYGTLLEDVITFDISLIVAKSGNILWSESYDRPYSVKNLSNLKSDIAFHVLDGIQATISEEEAVRIQEPPDIELIDYDLYMQAEELLWQYQNDKNDSTLLLEAEKLYTKTVEQEPTFARAYLGLAKVYWQKHYWNEILAPNFMETFNAYIDTAFVLDDKLDELYLLKGRYFHVLRDLTAAITHYNYAISLNANSWEAYRNLGWIYINEDHIKSLKNLFKATELYNGPEIDSLYEIISNSFAFAGFYDLSKQYAEEALKLNHDSVAYLYLLARNENWTGNFDKSIELCLEVLNLDPHHGLAIDRLAYNYMLKGAYEKAYPYYKMIEPGDWIHVENNIHRYALVYGKAGKDEESHELFEIHKNILLSIIELGRGTVLTYYDLAGIYAYSGNKEEALALLNRVNHYSTPNDWFVTLIKNDPLFDNIQDEPLFQQLVQELEAKREMEYERVRQWLDEFDIL